MMTSVVGNADRQLPPASPFALLDFCIENRLQK